MVKALGDGTTELLVAKYCRRERTAGRLCQKLGSMLCCAQRSRASSVVTKGFLLTCTRREAPVLSLWMMASLGIR